MALPMPRFPPVINATLLDNAPDNALDSARVEGAADRSSVPRMLVMRILPSLDHVFYAMLILVCITGPGKSRIPLRRRQQTIR
jgi:hypothetical protein